MEQSRFAAQARVEIGLPYCYGIAGETQLAIAKRDGAYVVMVASLDKKDDTSKITRMPCKNVLMGPSGTEILPRIGMKAEQLNLEKGRPLLLGNDAVKGEPFPRA